MTGRRPFARAVTAWALAAPLAALVAGFVLLPVLGTFWSSLWRDVAFLAPRFTGWGNYRDVFADASFLASCRFTFLFVAVTVPVELGLGLLAALLLNERFAGRAWLRLALLVPWAVPTVVSARVWELIFNYQYGIANHLATGFGFGPVNWLGSASSAFLALAAAEVWKTTPFVALILLAGLQGIPGELYEQAAVDRAGLFRRLVHITLPLLAPSLVIALLFRSIDALRIFDLVYVLTRGGPGGATSPLSFYAYNYYAVGDFGRGGAVSVLLFLAAFALSAYVIRRGRFPGAVA